MRRLKLVMKSKLNSGSKINAVNISAVALLGYRGVITWTKNELQNMDRMTRNVMKMNKDFKIRRRDGNENVA